VNGVMMAVGHLNHIPPAGRATLNGRQTNIDRERPPQLSLLTL
jgi:hypothetical protein